MTILHLNEWVDLKGGVEVYIGQLQQLFTDVGHKSYLIGIHQYEGYFTVQTKETGERFSIHNREQLFRWLNRFIEAHHIDLINIHNIFNIELIKFCLDKRPVMKFAHGPVMVCPGKDKFWRYSERPCTIKYGLHCFRHIYTEGCANRHPRRVIKAWNYVNFETRYASKRYKRIVVMSDYIRAGLIECGIPEQNILLNPYFTPVTQTVHFAPPGEIKKLVFVGRLVSSKGPQIVIDALESLIRRRTDIHIYIVGDGLLRAELVKKVNQAGLSDKVFFTGWAGREQVNDMIDGAFLILFPSVYPEAFGIVGIEAMMRGKPVIGFDVGGVSTWLENGVTGYMVNNKDLSAFEQKTELLLDDHEKYMRMAGTARKIAQEKYSPQRHIKELLDAYQKAIV